VNSLPRSTFLTSPGVVSGYPSPLSPLIRPKHALAISHPLISIIFSSRLRLVAANSTSTPCLSTLSAHFIVSCLTNTRPPYTESSNSSQFGSLHVRPSPFSYRSMGQLMIVTTVLGSLRQPPTANVRATTQQWGWIFCQMSAYKHIITTIL
jgi:hypothetical protein